MILRVGERDEARCEEMGRKLKALPVVLWPSGMTPWFCAPLVCWLFFLEEQKVPAAPLPTPVLAKQGQIANCHGSIPGFPASHGSVLCLQAGPHAEFTIPPVGAQTLLALSQPPTALDQQ